MKNNMLFRSIISITLLASCFAKAEVAETTLRAQCRVQSDPGPSSSNSRFSDYFGQVLIRLYNPFVASFALIGEHDHEVKVDANFGVDTWITYRASFDFLGEKVTVTFSNYLSPSLGKMVFPDGRSKFLACSLQDEK